MRVYQYNSYKRIHKFSHASDIEKEKISRETSNYIKYEKKINEMVKRLETVVDENDIEEISEESETYEYASKKEMRNARGHKNRLKKFQEHEDFN